MYEFGQAEGGSKKLKIESDAVEKLMKIHQIQPSNHQLVKYLDVLLWWVDITMFRVKPFTNCVFVFKQLFIGD